MRQPWIASAAVLALLILVDAASAQPRRRPGGTTATPSLDSREQKALDKLALTGASKEKADDVLDEYQAKVRKQIRTLREDFLKQLKETVTADEYGYFKEMLDTAPGSRAVSVHDLVERIMKYDKNKTGKVTKAELPERMHGLIAQGDANGDGCLDRAEVLKLTLSKLGRQQGSSGRDFTVAEAERALAKLHLADAAKSKAQVALDAYKDGTSKVAAQRRDNVIQHMSGTLTEEQLKLFKEALPAS